MSRARELMLLHLDALFTRDDAGRLLRVREHAGAPAPRFFLGRTEAGSVLAYRHDVTDRVRRELEVASMKVARFEPTGSSAGSRISPAEYTAILARDAATEKTEMGPVFYVPDRHDVARSTLCDALILVNSVNTTVLHPLMREWTHDVHRSQPLVALVLDRRAVAVCGSVRKTAQVHEAGVEVAEAFRRRGYAALVVAAWARAVRACGAEPLYSTDWHNTASRAVARTLGLIMYGEELTVA